MVGGLSAVTTASPAAAPAHRTECSLLPRADEYTLPPQGLNQYCSFGSHGAGSPGRGQAVFGVPLVPVPHEDVTLAQYVILYKQMFPYNLVTPFPFVVYYKLSHWEPLSGNKYISKMRVDEKRGT